MGFQTASNPTDTLDFLYFDYFVFKKKFHVKKWEKTTALQV